MNELEKQEEIEEAFFSGFCKAQNQSRTVLCEVIKKQDKVTQILSTDCSYGPCPHSKACLLLKIAEG